MYRILPAPTVEIDTDDAYRAPRELVDGKPWLMVNMIGSVDGAVAIDGVSGGLGSLGDKDVFGTVRSIPDVILAGAGTVIAEDYGPPSSSVSSRARRLGFGAWPVARIAVVSNSLSIDPESRLFDSKDSRPIVLTSEASDPDRRAQLQRVADVIVVGVERVDLTRALGALADIGARVVLSEGGPTLNAQLAADDLVDELCVSVSPLIVGGTAGRIFQGAPLDTPTDLELHHVLTEDHYLFLRYVKGETIKE